MCNDDGILYILLQYNFEWITDSEIPCTWHVCLYGTLSCLLAVSPFTGSPLGSRYLQTPRSKNIQALLFQFFFSLSAACFLFCYLKQATSGTSKGYRWHNRWDKWLRAIQEEELRWTERNLYINVINNLIFSNAFYLNFSCFSNLIDPCA